MATTKTALVLVANGTEEMEAVISIDVLRRAQISVTVAAVGVRSPVQGANGSVQPSTPFIVSCSRQVRLVADTRVEDLVQPNAADIRSFDVVVVPGGLEGARTMAEDEHVKRLLYLAWTGGFTVAAICAGPTVLKAANVGLGGEVTSYPGVRDLLENAYKYQEKRVVVSKLAEANIRGPLTTDNTGTTVHRNVGTVITSRGPCTSFEFAITIVTHLCGAEKAAEVWKAMVPWTDFQNVVG